MNAEEELQRQLTKALAEIEGLKSENARLEKMLGIRSIPSAL